MQEKSEIEIKDNFGRLKGASWFNEIYKKDILVIGSGGIASWTNFLLARCGATLHIFDFDIIEEHNLGGQLFRFKDVGKSKVQAIKDIIGEFCEAEVNIYNEKYTSESITNNITIMGVDNMSTRKIGFENWLNYINENPEEKDNSLFIDGRLSMTVLQIFCIKGNDLSAITKYQQEHLFDDSQVEEEECTAKQTSHCAAMIASHIVGFLTNFLAPESFDVPFFYSYIIPPNMTENENSI